MLSTERNKEAARVLIKHKRTFRKRDPPYTRERPENVRGQQTPPRAASAPPVTGPRPP